MKRWIKVYCAVVMALLAAGILYWYGFTSLSVVVAVMLLLCPLFAIWQGFRLSKLTDREIDKLINEKHKSP